MTKPTVAFFDFASCEGCQIELLNYGDEIFLELLKHIEIVEFREAMSEKTSQPIDIACIEGSFTRPADLLRLRNIRSRANIVLSYGQCASTAGITALKNHQKDYQQFVYAADAKKPHLNSDYARAISSVIKVDYQVLGCPVNKYEFLDIISHLLHHKEPVIPNYPVCVECKRNETVCRFLAGDHCMGMVSRAGCGAPCPADGIPCEGCRGFVDHPNQDALVKVLMKKGGLSQTRAESKSQLFNANEREDAHDK